MWIIDPYALHRLLAVPVTARRGGRTVVCASGPALEVIATTAGCRLRVSLATCGLGASWSGLVSSEIVRGTASDLLALLPGCEYPIVAAHDASVVTIAIGCRRWEWQLIPTADDSASFGGLVDEPAVPARRSPQDDIESFIEQSIGGQS